MEPTPCIKVEENGDGLPLGTVVDCWDNSVVPPGFVRLENAVFDEIEDDGVFSLETVD